MQNIGDVKLGASSAGSTNTFSLIEDTGSSGAIMLTGAVGAGSSAQSGTIVLRASGTGDIVGSGFALTAGTVALSSDSSTTTGGGTGDISAGGTTPILTNTANFSANTGGNVFAKNTGNVALGASSAGAGNTFSLVEDTGSIGGITLAGAIGAGSAGQTGTIVLRTSGAGNIDDTAAVTLTAGTITLSSDSAAATGSGTGNIGSGTGPLPVLTNTANLTVNTGGDVFVKNTGDVTLNASSAGAANTFSLTEDTGTSGAITLAGNVTAGSAAQTGTIVLASSGTGAIIGAANTLTAGTVTLRSDIGGTPGGGSGDISAGAGTSPLLTNSANLTANTTGNVYIQDTVSVNLGASRAGSANTFSLIENQSTNGAIALVGAVGAGSDVAGGTIILRGAGTGGISDVGGFTLTANTIMLSSDITATTGGGTGNIGSVDNSAPILTDTSNLTAATSASAGSVNISNNGGTVVITGTNTGLNYTVVSTNGGSITENGAIAAHNLTLQAAADLNVNNLFTANQDASGNGGSITFIGATLNNTSGSALNLNADGSGTGDGGTITLRTGSGGIALGNGAAGFLLSATGGTGGGTPSSAGDGGTITVDSGGALNLANGAAVAGVLGTNGTGATISLTAVGNLDLSAITSLDASGVGTGAGGSVTIGGGSITFAGGSPFAITANAGTASTTGGSISVSILGGAQDLTLTNITVSSGPGSAAPQLSLSAKGNGLLSGGGSPLNGVSVNTSGNIFVYGSGIDVGGAAGANANGGNVNLSAGTNSAASIVFADATATLFNGGTVGAANTNGKGTGNGGVISLLASSAITVATASPLAVNGGANGGNGGLHHI